MSKATFLYILGKIRQDIKKDVLTEDPISPECRLAIRLYRLGRGDYLFTISEIRYTIWIRYCNSLPNCN